MSRLILHIGTHKTATTSIQRFLRRNDAALAERGVWYPGYEAIGAPDHYAHLDIFNALSGQSRSFDPAQARTYLSEIRARAGAHDVTILSAEPSYRHVDPPGDTKVPGEPEIYWPRRQAYIDRLRELLGPAEIAVVFRRQNDYARSLYQEHVKVSRLRRGFRSYIADYWYHFAYLDQVRAWQTAFGAPTVMGFERLLETGDVVGAFCDRLGIDAAGLERPEAQNQGLVPDLVILKRILHGLPDAPRDLKERMMALSERIPPDTREALARRTFFDGPKKEAEFQDQFAADNARLSVLAGCAEGEALFPPLPPPASGEGLYGDKLNAQFLDVLSRCALAAPRAEAEAGTGRGPENQGNGAEDPPPGGSRSGDRAGT